MPIFTSRFSPERSLIGTFLSPRSQETEDAESRATGRRTNSASTSRTPPGEDRLDLTGAQQTERSVTRARTSDQTPETRTGESPENRQVARQFGLQRALRETTQARASLQTSAEPTPIPAETEAAPPANTTLAIARENDEASQRVAPARLEALNNRLAEIRIDIARQAVQNENGLAAQNAAPERLQNLVAQTAETPLAAPAEDTDESPLSTTRNEGNAERLTDNVERRQQQPVAPPERGEQEADLRRDLQSIATGLRADAAMESQRAVEQTARATESAVQNEQRSTVRENQTEIRSLQASRRQLQQDTQRADQAIRQLQNENARLKNGATAPTTTIDILAQ